VKNHSLFLGWLHRNECPSALESDDAGKNFLKAGGL
jgi:hypothetical protein